MQTNRRKVNGNTAMEMDSSLGSFDQLGHVAVTGIEARPSIDDPDNWTREGIFRVTQGFNEDFAQEQREMGIAV